MRKKNMNEFASFQDVLSGSQRNASVVHMKGNAGIVEIIGSILSIVGNIGHLRYAAGAYVKSKGKIGLIQKDIKEGMDDSCHNTAKIHCKKCCGNYCRWHIQKHKCKGDEK